MGGTLSTEEEEGFTIERSSTVRSEKDLTTSTRKLLTPKEEERLKQKREEVRAIREQNKLMTLRTRMRMEMSQKLNQEFKERVIMRNEEEEETESKEGQHLHRAMLKRNVKRTRSPREQLEHKSATKIQSSWRGYRIRRKYGKIAKRTIVAKELLETEKDYIQYLNALVNVYLIPLREKAESDTPLLTVEELKTIFPQIEMILMYNKQLYDVLDERIRVKWNAEQTIGDAFLALIDSLKQPYTHYIANFPVITQQIKSVAKRIRVAMFFNSRKNLPECGGLDISALASMPFQRIPRYILLLKEVIANTHSTHPDHAHLEEAISRMDVLAKTANEKLRENETQRSLQSISDRLEPPIKNLMKPFRKLIREGTMRYKINHSARRTPTGFRPGLIFLFTDCLMITEQINKSVAKLFVDTGVIKLRPIDVLNLNNATVLNIMEDYKDRNDIAQAINSITETAISYKSKVRRKSVAYGINRKSTSVRLPENVAKAILNSDESLFSSSPSSSSSNLSPFNPLSTPPLGYAPVLGATPSTPSPSIATDSPSTSRVVATTPTGTPRMSLPAPGFIRQNSTNLSALPTFLSIQRYTSNANQGGSLYFDNTPPSSSPISVDVSATPLATTPPIAAFFKKSTLASSPLSSSPTKKPAPLPSNRPPKSPTVPTRSSPKSSPSSANSTNDVPSLPVSETPSSSTDDKVETRIKSYNSEFSMDINVNVDELNFNYEDQPEEEEATPAFHVKDESEDESENEAETETEKTTVEEEIEKSDLTTIEEEEGDQLLQRLNYLEMDIGSSTNFEGFETFDEMAIRITNTLDTKQSFMGFTRTNSESEISRRKSLVFHSVPQRSSSFSNLDGLLGR